MRSRNLDIVLVLLIVVTFATGCGQAAAEPIVTPQPSPTVTSPPARPQKAQPSTDTSPLPQPKTDGPASSTSPLPTPVPTPKPPEQSAVPIPSNATKVVELAQADLATALGIAKDQVQVVAVEAIDWPDAGLGCPQPGQMYAQVITSGFHVVLRVGEEDYTYHTDHGSVAVLCEEESKSPGEKEVVMTPEPTIPSPQDPQLQRLVAVAQEDLAKRLGISADQVDLIEVREVTWSDASLGCPHPDMRYAQVPVDGLLIRLSVEGQTYEYHSGGSREPFLCEQAKAAKGTITPQELVPPPGSESD